MPVLQRPPLHKLLHQSMHLDLLHQVAAVMFRMSIIPLWYSTTNWEYLILGEVGVFNIETGD